LRRVSVAASRRNLPPLGVSLHVESLTTVDSKKTNFVDKLILASNSPRRRELLRGAGVDLQVHAAEVDEAHVAGEAASEYVRRIARAKAHASANTWRTASPEMRSVLLAADTTVWISESLAPLGKPADRDEARRYLQTLTADCAHFVSTCFVILVREAKSATWSERACETVTTKVFMRKLEPQELETHLDRGEWSDKAGGYAIQGAAAAFVDRIEGSYTNVVGLPLSQVCVALRNLKLQMGHS
jgi:septum formation protein